MAVLLLAGGPTATMADAAGPTQGEQPDTRGGRAAQTEEAPAAPPSSGTQAPPDVGKRLDALEEQIRQLKAATPPAPPPPPITQVPPEVDKRLDLLEEWKAKVERLPSLSNKVNFGLNALQWQYEHLNAHVPEGKSQDNFFIRRSEVLAYGTINEYVPKWHILVEFQSTGLSNTTPNVPGQTGTPTSDTFFRESYIDVRPSVNLAPSLNFVRVGIFRMPFGIFTETSGGLRDIVSSPYLTSVGTGNGNATGAAGKIDFLQERDYFVDVRGTLANRLEYVAGLMNNNNFTGSLQAGGIGANQSKAFYSRIRLLATDVSFLSFTTIQGASNNAGTQINGRGKGYMSRYGVDFRYVSKAIPGLYIQGEWWTGQDAPNATTVGVGANGACQNTTVCGGSGAPGVERRTWYVYAKYYIADGLFKNFEPIVWYEQFDPNTNVSGDLYTRTIVGFNYYIQNLPPKIQTKLQVNYEFRHHSLSGCTTSGSTCGLSTFGGQGGSINDPFAQNAFYVQLQVRYQ
ncbi:hypothetical protein [Nitrospira sp. Kam-Ns4a]